MHTDGWRRVAREDGSSLSSDPGDQVFGVSTSRLHASGNMPGSAVCRMLDVHVPDQLSMQHFHEVSCESPHAYLLKLRLGKARKVCRTIRHTTAAPDARKNRSVADERRDSV
jgi:hypothetical protein